jgi:predicted NBD/HSP70 family sugar kinase
MADVELLLDQKRVLLHLRKHGAASRVVIAKALGMNTGIVTRYSRELISLGLVEEHEEEKSGGRGRPSTPLSIRKDGAYAVGAVVHPGWVTVAAVDFEGAPITTELVSYEDKTPEKFAAIINERLRAMIASGAVIRSKFLGFGISVPGYVMPNPTRRITVQALETWREIDLQRVFEDHLQAPVWIENDASTAALADYYDFGLHKGQSLLSINIGYGVGGGVIAEGGMFRGEHLNAGEIGAFFPLDAPRPSAIDLLRVLQEAGVKIASLYDLDTVGEHHYDIIEKWCKRAADQLFIAVQSGIAWLDPACIVITGSLPTWIVDLVVSRLQNQDWRHTMGMRNAPDIVASRLGANASALGAAHLPIHYTCSPAW